MRLTTTGLVILLVTLVSGDSTNSSQYTTEKSPTNVEITTEATLTKVTEKSATTVNDKIESTQSGKMGETDKIDLPPDKDMTAEGLLLMEKIIDEEDRINGERKEMNSNPNGAESKAKTDNIESEAKTDNIESKAKTDNIESNSETSVESEISRDFVDMQRQESSLKTKQENSSPAIEFDDSKAAVMSDPLQRFGQRTRKPERKTQDGVPLLQLTQGGYERPYKRSRTRYSSASDSSEQSEKMQKPDRTFNNKMASTRHTVPHVTYSSSQQPPYTFGQGPVMNPAFDTSARNIVALNQIIPTPAQNGFLNAPPELSGYSSAIFQPQFSSSNDVGNFPNFGRIPNNVGVYQPMPSNPFETPGIIFQNPPPMQPQRVLVDAERNSQSQFPQDPLISYPPGFQTTEDSSTPNYSTFYRNPALNIPFQIPSNFYGSSPNTIIPFNNPAVSFMSQYPNFDSRVTSQIFQYPDVTKPQNNQQPSNNQQFVSDPSQDQNKVKDATQNTEMSINRDDPLSPRIGTRLQAENVADVYMRYPTLVAGYATEENLPSQNNSDESRETSKQISEKQNISDTNPYRNILGTLRSNKKINNSFDFPAELFRDVPIEFGYRRPQSEIIMVYPDRSRGVPNYPSRNFESRIPFNTVPSLPESFIGVNNQQYAPQEFDGPPSCAKENNVSVCFEDKDYPKNEIMYSLNSNSFVVERLMGPEQSLSSFAFVERNGNETEQNEENYACDSNTKYGMPLRAKNLAGIWRVIVNLKERFSQPVRMEVCKTLGVSCSYTDNRIKTTCVQKYSLQRLLTWNSVQGIFSDVYKIPVACSCQITKAVES